MKNLLFILLLSTIVVSCKKEKTIHITATNVATGERLAGLKYSVVESSAGSFGEKSKVVKSGYLDSNGEAKFTMRIKKANILYLLKNPITILF